MSEKNIFGQMMITPNFFFFSVILYFSGLAEDSRVFLQTNTIRDIICT